MLKRHDELAPCGVYCGACPSFGKTCLGCASESREQKRTSKWTCGIRRCCYDAKKLDYCIECDEFPCRTYRAKLLKSHVGDPRFRYRHEIPRIFPKLLKDGVEEFLRHQAERWSCPRCGGRVLFYLYECSRCKDRIEI